MDTYKDIRHEKLETNPQLFLDGILLIAKKNGFKIATRSDDPQFDVCGLLSVISTLKNMKRLGTDNPGPNNGLTFCTNPLVSELTMTLLPWLRSLGIISILTTSRQLKELLSATSVTKTTLPEMGQSKLLSINLTYRQ